MLAMLLVWVFAGATFFHFWSWAFDSALQQYLQRQSAKLAGNYDLALAERLARLNSEQLEAFMAILHSEPTITATKDSLVINGVSVPSEFIRELIASTRDGYIKPERDYSEGSTERLYYKTITNYLIRQGLAEPASGNKPVKVPSWRSALQVLGGV